MLRLPRTGKVTRGNLQNGAVYEMPERASKVLEPSDYSDPFTRFATRMIAATLASTSSSVVAQFETEMRIAV